MSTRSEGSAAPRTPIRRRVISGTVALLLLLNLVVPAGSIAAAGPPVADVGLPDRTVQAGSWVELDGGQSVDPGGSPLTYSWAQTSGPSVALSPLDASGAVQQFFAPPAASAEVLTFELTVGNGSENDTAGLSVTVVPGTSPRRVSLPTGRSGYQDIKALGRNVYVAWCYRNGDALNIYFTRSTDGGASYEQPQRLTPPGGGLGDAEYPKIAVEGSHVYVTWRQWVAGGGGNPAGTRIYLASSSDEGRYGSFSLRDLAPAVANASLPEIAATVDGSSHYAYVMYGCTVGGSREIRISYSQNGAGSFVASTVATDVAVGPGPDNLALVAKGDRAYGAYVAANEVRLFKKQAGQASVPTTGFPGTHARGPRLAISPDGTRVCVAWTSTDSYGYSYARAANVPASTFAGSVTWVSSGKGPKWDQSTPDVCWSDGGFLATWVELARSVGGGWDSVWAARLPPGGGLGTPVLVSPVSERSSGTRYYGRLANVAAVGDVVAVGWWDQVKDRTFTAMSRDGGATFDASVNQSTWTGRSGYPSLAANASTGSPAVHAAWAGNARFDPSRGAETDVFAKRLALTAPNNLVLEQLQVVQAPWDNRPQQYLAQDKQTAFRLDVESGFDHAVTTDVELRYAVTTGGSTQNRKLTKSVTLAPYDSKAVYFSGIRLKGDSVEASATVNTADSPPETDASDNDSGLTPRSIYETRKLDGLFVPVVVPGDTAPSAAQFSSSMGSWSKFIAETYPIDDAHWLKETKASRRWSPNLPGYTPGSKLTVDQWHLIVAQMQGMATLSGHDVALGALRTGWFSSVMTTDYASTVGLAPYNSKTHAVTEEVGQPSQIGAHEIAHTYGLVPAGTLGDMAPPNDGHFNRLVATGWSWARGEIRVVEGVRAPYDFMHWTAVPNCWVSPFTYYTLLNRLMPSAPDPPVVLLSGVVDKSGTAELLPAYRFEDEPDVALGNTGALEIVFRDGSNAVLATAGFDLSFAITATDGNGSLSGSTVSDTAPFSVRVPWVPGAERIELVYDGDLAAARDVSPNAPLVSVTTPAAGAAYSVGETVTVSWGGADLDSDPLLYTPMLSTDDGATWAPIASDIATTTCEFVPTREDVTENARIKVVVTDGVNSGEAVSGAFAIRPVVPTATGGGAPTWGPLQPFPIADEFSSQRGLDYWNWKLGASGDTVYAGWVWHAGSRLKVATSRDRGQTWGMPVDVAGLVSLDDTTGEDIDQMQVFTFDGDDIYVLTNETAGATEGRLVLRRSTDAGTSFPHSTVISTFARQPAYPYVAFPRLVTSGEDVYVSAVVQVSSALKELWLFRSRDKGATFDAPVAVAQGQYIMSTDMSADGQNVYISYDQQLGGARDVMLVSSLDAGDTFSAPVTVLSGTYYQPKVAADGPRVHVAARRADLTMWAASSADYGGTFGTARGLGPTAQYNPYHPSPLIFAKGDDVTILWRGHQSLSPTIRKYPVYSSSSIDGGETFSPLIDLFASIPRVLPSYYMESDYPFRACEQGDSIYVAKQFEQSSVIRRVAVATSTDYGTSYGEPEVLEIDFEDPSYLEKVAGNVVLAAAPGLVYAGAGATADAYDWNAWLRVGTTGSAPAVSAGPDLALSEGQETSVTADFSADDASVATATIDWGDGETTSGLVSATGTTGTVEAAHAYGKHGIYDAKVRVTATGQSAEDTFSVTVQNSAPLVSVPTTTSVTTAGLLWRPTGIAFSDAGWGDTLSATIDWGDGSGAEAATLRVAAPGGGGAAQSGAIDGVHAYAAAGGYTALVTVSDGSAEATASFPVAVETNADPVAEAGGPYVGYEGMALSLDASASADPDGNVLSYSWMRDGEALGSPLVDNRVLVLSFPDDLSAELGLVVDDGRGGTDTVTTNLTILNLAPTVSATASTTVSTVRPLFVPVAEVATFTDPGVLDTHTATIDWDDGTTSAGVVEESGGSGSVWGGHTYSEAGTYTVRVEVTDKDGGVGSGTLGLTVVALNRPPVATDTTVTTTAGKPIALTLTATDPDGDPLTWLGVPVVAPTSGVLTGSPPDLTYTPNTGFVGDDIFAFQVSDGQGGSAVAHVTVTVAPAPVIPPTAKVTRISGGSPYQVALKASRDTFKAKSVSRVVLASGARWDDALAASGLAGTYHSPVLLTGRKSLPSGLVTELRRLGAKRIYIVGNTSSVPTGVLRKLKRYGFAVTRISGANRYEVAKNVALKIEAAQGNNRVSRAFVVRSDVFYDALSVSALAYGRKMPVLYTRPTSMSTNAARAIRALDIDEVIVIGGTAAVRSKVAAAFDRLPSVDKVTRWGGSNRVATSVALTKGALSRKWVSFGFVGMTSCVSYSDGLSASSATGYRHGPLLLSTYASVPSATSQLLVAHKAEVKNVWVFARTTRVRDSVLERVRQLLR